MSAFASLAGEPRWVAWRAEQRGPNGKLTKIPYSQPSLKARADDPSTWQARDAAEQLATKIVNGLGGGIGIELGDIGADLYLGGLDLDSCIDEHGCLALWAEQILVELPTYAETSPSGNGLKAFFYLASEDVRRFLTMLGLAADQWGTKRGIPGYSGSDHGPGVELYTSHRFFAVTEQLFPGRPDQIAVLDWKQLERLAALIPSPETQNNRRGSGRDDSRSAKAFREGKKLRGKGKSFDEFCDALRNHPNRELQQWTREKGEAYGARELSRIWDKLAAEDGIAAKFSEDELALRFSDEHADDLRYLAISSRWYRWTGSLWIVEQTLQAFDFARAICRTAAADPAAGKVARELTKAHTVAAVEKLARADRRHATTHQEWNTGSWNFSVPAKEEWTDD